MPPNKTIAEIKDFSGGVVKDRIDTQDPPLWRNLDNLWITPPGILQSRPHLLTYINEPSAIGVGKTHDRKTIAVVNGKVFIDGNNVGVTAGTGPLSFSYTRDYTAFCCGADIKLWDGTTLTTLSHTNVKCLAFAQGFNQRRLFFVKSDDLRTIWVTSPGNFEDVGMVLTDPLGIADDEYTEAGRIKGFPSDIIDIQEFTDELRIFCDTAIYTLNPNRYDEEGWRFTITKTWDIEVWDVKTKRYTSGILFLNGNGLNIFSIGETGPFAQPLKSDGVYNTIRKQLVEAEARIGIDHCRNLYLLKPNDTDDTWVFHVNGAVYTNWDVDFRDVIGVDGVAYVATDASVALLDDDGDGVSEFNILIRSGLTWLNSVRTRKRVKRFGANISFTRDINWSLEAYGDSIKDVPINYALLSSTSTIGNDIALTEDIEDYPGVRASAVSLEAAFKNKGKFNLNTFWLTFFDKGFRGISN